MSGMLAWILRVTIVLPWGGLVQFVLEFPNQCQTIIPVVFITLSVFETPVETDRNTRPVDDFQPLKQVKDYMAQGKLVTEEEIGEFSKKIITDKLLLKKYIEHLRTLEINKRKRFEKRQVLLEEEKNKKFEEYDWLSLLREGALKKLKVNELDKYLHHYKLCTSLKLKKKREDRLHHHPYCFSAAQRS
jgi:hypothetical protein